MLPEGPRKFQSPGGKKMYCQASCDHSPEPPEVLGVTPKNILNNFGGLDLAPTLRPRWGTVDGG